MCIRSFKYEIIMRVSKVPLILHARVMVGGVHALYMR